MIFGRHRTGVNRAAGEQVCGVENGEWLWAFFLLLSARAVTAPVLNNTELVARRKLPRRRAED